MFVLKNYPLPPSSNDLYASVRGRLVKTKMARLYEFEVQSYKLNQHSFIEEIKSRLKDEMIIVDCVFVFEKSRLISKENKLKKLDASNRLKICHDTLAKLIEIDDKNIVKGSFMKITCEHKHEEQVIIFISKMNKMITLDDFRRDSK